MFHSQQKGGSLPVRYPRGAGRGRLGRVGLPAGRPPSPAYLPAWAQGLPGGSGRRPGRAPQEEKERCPGRSTAGGWREGPLALLQASPYTPSPSSHLFLPRSLLPQTTCRP